MQGGDGRRSFQSDAQVEAGVGNIDYNGPGTPYCMYSVSRLIFKEIQNSFSVLPEAVQMPMVGFGTWDVRGEKGKRCIQDALELGYRLIDTAQMYDNEEMVGKAVRESGLPRQDIFLTTKLYRSSASYQKAKAGIEKSLNDLQTDIFAEPLLNQIGAEHGKSAAQVALRYLVQNGIAVIPKSVHKDRMAQNLDIFDFSLTLDDMDAIGQLNQNRSLFGWY